MVWDSIRYNPKTNNFAGFENSALSSNARLLSRQDVHFAIYNAAKKELYASNGFTPKLTASDWKHLKNGDIVKKKDDYPAFRRVNVEGKESYKTSSEMTLIIHPYFYKQKLVAIVTIGTFVSTIRQNVKQLLKNFVFAFLLYTHNSPLFLLFNNPLPYKIQTSTHNDYTRLFMLITAQISDYPFGI